MIDMTYLGIGIAEVNNILKYDCIRKILIVIGTVICFYFWLKLHGLIGGLYDYLLQSICCDMKMSKSNIY